MNELVSNPDEDLVRTAQTGDGQAFTELLSRHKHRLFSLVSRFTRDPHQIDDLVQETTIQAWLQLRKFRREAPFEHWLIKIAVHTAYDFLREQQRTRARQTLPLESQEIAIETDGSAEEAREIVEAALAQLKPEEQLILTLLELEEKSIREIAQLTGWGESKVKMRAARAREALKKVIGKTGNFRNPNPTR